VWLALFHFYEVIKASPTDAKAPGLKRPSNEVLKKFLLCMARMAKKNLSAVRDIKKVMVFPSNIIKPPPQPLNCGFD
jgi:hypothetical protein